MEAALVLPVLVVIFLGMVDVSLLFRDHVSATALTRSGARVASAEPRFGTINSTFGHTGAGNSSSFAQDAADAIERAGTALPRNSIDYIWVYRATSDGYPENGNGDFSSCPSSSCVAYRWVDATPTTPGRFTYQSGLWDPKGIDSCLGTGTAQSVGVYIKATHPWLFGVFGSPTTTVTARTVMKFEPRTVFDSENLPTTTTPGFFAGCK